MKPRVTDYIIAELLVYESINMNQFFSFLMYKFSQVL